MTATRKLNNKVQPTGLRRGKNVRTLAGSSVGKFYVVNRRESQSLFDKRPFDHIVASDTDMR